MMRGDDNPALAASKVGVLDQIEAQRAHVKGEALVVIGHQQGDGCEGEGGAHSLSGSPARGLGGKSFQAKSQ